LPDKRFKLTTLVQLANTFLTQGRISKAIEAQENAYKTAIESGSPARLTYLFQTAALYIKLGDFPAAYTRFRRVLAESEKSGDKGLYFSSLLNIAQINEQYGRDKKASELYQRVIEFANDGLKDGSAVTRRGFVTGKAEAVSRLAEMQFGRGGIKASIDLYKQNLEMLRSAQAEPEPETRDIPPYGTYIIRGRPRWKEAFAALEVSVQTRLGDLHSLTGDRSAAASHLSSGLSIAESIGYESGSIDTLLSMATHSARFADPTAANAYLARAEVLVQRSGRPDQLIRLRTTSGEVLVKLGRLAAADLKFQEALRISESLRADVTMPDQRASYFAGLFRPFDQYIDFLMERHAKQPDAGFDRRAFDVSERRRARALLDSLRVARADIRQGVEPALLDEEARIRAQLNSAARTHFGGVDPLLIRADTDGDPVNVPVGSPKTDLTVLAAELTRIETAIRKRSPRYAELMQPRPLRSHAVQALLDNGTILLNYTLGEERSYLWAISNQSVSSFVLPPRERIEELIKTAYAGLSDPAAAEERKGMAVSETEMLARILLGPAADLLGNRRIVVVADGALQYLPFSSLPDPRLTAGAGGPILSSNEIQFAPSASVVSVLRFDLRDRAKAPGAVAIFADPVFSEDDERLDGRRDERPASVRSDDESITRDLLVPRIGEDGDSNSIPHIARLPFSRDEADAIFDSSPVGSSIKAVNFEASRETLASIDLSRYRIVHFATHGLLDSEQPELSGIVLSLVNEKGEPVNGFLRLNEIYNMKLNADLVVLSACQTALGKEVRGEGLIGLTRGFMYAGSPRVVASLWKVDDVATAQLMKIFYAKMLKENMSPAAALRAAKVAMMKQKRWSSPYYWAAFELQGEWR
jgi:CHAT domain-containing protein